MTDRLSNLKNKGKGRPLWSVNQFTTFKADLLAAYQEAGGKQYLITAFKDPRLKGDMIRLMGRLLPHDLTVKERVPTVVNFVTRHKPIE